MVKMKKSLIFCLRCYSLINLNILFIYIKNIYLGFNHKIIGNYIKLSIIFNKYIEFI
jgi:hypothetical protein